MKKRTHIFLSFYLILISFNYIKSSLKFNIPNDHEKCFQQEIYLEGTLLIRYDLSGFEKYFKSQEQQYQLFQSIHIKIKNEAGHDIHISELKSRKDKFAMYLKNIGIYQICVIYNKPKNLIDLPDDIFMGLKIRSDYHYTEIEKSLHKNDIKDFWNRIKNIKRDIFPSIEAEKKEIEEEDITTKSMINSIYTYYYLCLLQLIIVIIMIVFTIGNFKKYFKSISII